MIRRRVIFLLLGAGGALLAQEPEVRRAIPVDQSNEPEVRRAIPVDQPTPGDGTIYENPSWMQQVTPNPTPVPAPTVAPGPEPGFTPYRPQGHLEVSTPAPAPAEPPGAEAITTPPDENGAIRLSPSQSPGDSAAVDLNLANSVYARKMYDYAVTEYEKFLIAYPAAKGRDQALFRLGESHRLLGNEAPARDAYERLLREFQTGEFAGAGAYRLGEYLLADKLYDAAIKQFETASTQASSPEVRLSATYDEAQAWQQLKQTDNAIKKYQEVAAIEKDNPYRNYALLSLAELSAASGDKQGALKEFGELANGTAPAELRAEAGVKAGALAAELGDAKAASAYFDQAIHLSDSGAWKSVAILGALRAYYAVGNYEKVTALSDKMLDQLPAETQAEALLLTANSYRQQGKPREAAAVYDRLITKYPDASQTQDARFQKLLSMYQLNDPKILETVKAFLATSTDERERAQASLLEAETLFKMQNYTEAGPLYAAVLTSKLDDSIKSKAMLKLGWCFSKVGQSAQAADTFTAFLEKYPNDPAALSAMIQRGLARQDLKDYPGALKDFDQIINQHPDAPERELALQQKALIQGQQNDYKGMTATFTEFLKDYPKSAAAAQANFWIGWAAYENKDYKSALPGLQAARDLDPNQYGIRAGVRMVLCYYYLQDRDSLKKLLDANKKLEVPTEVTRWLGEQSFADGDYAGAAKYLLAAVKDPKNADPTNYIELAEALIRQGLASEAAPYAATYLTTAREPYSRARGLLAQGRIALAAKQYDEAVKHDDDALLLQPEGPLNAEGRLLTGEISLAQGQYEEAAKAFLTVAVLYDDPKVTPRALDQAAAAYRKAGNAFEAEKAEHELEQRFPDFKKSAKVTKDNP